jgi:DNA-binding transcriptional MocR family regulator
VHRQVARTVLAVQAHFPAGCRLCVPEGGNMLWVELPPGADGERLYREARAAGISIVPGAAFSTTGRFRGHVRLSCTSPFSARIEAAIGALGALVRAQLRSRAAGSLLTAATPPRSSPR